jgi:hypothetical protein
LLRLPSVGSELRHERRIGQRKLLLNTGLAHFAQLDLRRTSATTHTRIGTPIHLVEAMLNHRSGTISGVAAIYIRHSYLEEMRNAVMVYERHNAELCRPPSGPTDDQPSEDTVSCGSSCVRFLRGRQLSDGQRALVQ